MCFWNLSKALFMSPTWATWAILIAPAVVLVIWILVKRQTGVGEVEGAAPVYGAVGASWRTLGWMVLLTALVFYLIDVGLFFGGKTRAQNKTFEQQFIRQSKKTQSMAALRNGFLSLLGSVDESERTQLLVEQGGEVDDRSAFLQEGDAVDESMLKKSLFKLPGMTSGKRKDWLDTRHYKDLIRDLSQNEWGKLLGTLGGEDGVVDKILGAQFSYPDRRGLLWDAVMELSPLPPWMKVAYHAGCVLQAKLVKFFIAALGWLRGAIQLLVWLIVGFVMVLSGGRIVRESQKPLYTNLDELLAQMQNKKSDI